MTCRKETMIRVPVEQNVDMNSKLTFTHADVVQCLEEAVSCATFMWFEYHWPNGTMERSMEVRQMNIGKQETPEKDGLPKAAHYPKFVVFED